jgi:hypothetical protein
MNGSSTASRANSQLFFHKESTARIGSDLEGIDPVSVETPLFDYYGDHNQANFAIGA